MEFAFGYTIRLANRQRGFFKDSLRLIHLIGNCGSLRRGSTVLLIRIAKDQGDASRVLKGNQG